MVRLNRIVPVVVFVMSSSAVIYSDHLGGESSSAAVDPSSSSSSHRSDTDAVQRRLDDGLIRSTWRLLASAVSGQVIGLRHTARQHLDDDDDDDVNSPSVMSALRHRSTDEVDDGIRPTDRSRTDGVDDKDESTGTWRSDDRTDEGTKYEEQQQQQQLRGEQRLPQAIIIGVKKGGTRALLEFLRTHPDVRAPGPEIHFFDKNYYRGLGWYRRQMPVTLLGQITVEKTPSYWITREVPARLFNMSRDVRLVVVVRDPATRALSDYAQAMTKRPDVGSFERLAFLRRRDATAAAAAVDTSWGAIRIGMYARHLERWLEHFPRRSIHFVNGERLIADPAGELAGVQDFLRLKRIITDKHFFFNATKGFPCLKKSEGSGNPRCLGKTKGRPHPPVDEQVLRRLRDFYRPFNEKFYQMTGIDFNWP